MIIRYNVPIQYVQLHVDTSTIYSVYFYWPFVLPLTKLHQSWIWSWYFLSHFLHILSDMIPPWNMREKNKSNMSHPFDCMGSERWHHRYLCRPWRCTHRLLRFISVATLYDILMAATLLGSVTAMMPSPLKSKNWQINSRNIFTTSKVFS